MPIHRTIALLAIAALATQARAEPLDRRLVPADAKFVVSVDVDAARESAAGKAINDKLAAVPDYQRKIAQVSVVTGMTYPQDLHDVTLYTREPNDQGIVIVAHAHMDRPRMLTALSTTPDHAIHHVGAYDVVRWTDGGKTLFGAFHDDGTLVVAHTEANVSAALDTIDRTAPSTPLDGPFSGTAPATTRPAVRPREHALLFVAINDVPGLVAAKGVEVPGPLQQVVGGCLSIVDDGGTLSLRVNLTAKTAEAAEQLRAAAEGLRAMLAFSAAGSDGQPNIGKQGLALLNRTTFGRADQTMTADVSIPADALTVFADGKRFTMGMDPAKVATTRPAAGR